MTPELSDVALIFTDLEAAFASLQASSFSPREVRRALARFTTLSQQLTETMRKEFSNQTGTAWVARHFVGWTPVTEVFKALRNADLHGEPIQILVHETLRARSDLGAIVSFSGTWELHDQQAEEPPSGLQLVRADPLTGGSTDDPLPIVSRSFVFLLRPRTDELKVLLEAAETADVHALAASCIQTLREYREYYRVTLS